MEGQSELSKLSVISWVSAAEGCPLRGSTVIKQSQRSNKKNKCNISHVLITLPVLPVLRTEESNKDIGKYDTCSFIGFSWLQTHGSLPWHVTCQCVLCACWPCVGVRQAMANWQHQASHKWGKKWSSWSQTNWTGGYSPVCFLLFLLKMKLVLTQTSCMTTNSFTLMTVFLIWEQ